MKIHRLLALIILLINSMSLFGRQNEISTDFNPQSGDNVTVWQDYKDNQFNIFVSVNIGESTIGPMEVGNPLVHPRKPIAAINTSHQVAVVWLGVDPETRQTSLYGTMYDPDKGWTPPTLISEPHLECVNDHVNIKLAETGKVIVSWKSYLHSSQQASVRLSQSSTFGTWGNPIHLAN